MSWKGEVVRIQVGEKGKPLRSLEEAVAVTDKGIEGDRHFGKPKRQVTLIAVEALEGTGLTHEDSRRDILVRGVPLSDLLEARFRIGALVLEGTGPCEPCTYMEELCGKPGAKDALIGKGGLCARVIEGGPFRPGDPVEPA